MYLWWSLCILYLYACQWELLQATQVFVFVLVWLFRALINSLVRWFVAGHWCHWPRQYSVNELDTCLKTILSLRDVGEYGNILQGPTTANVPNFPRAKPQPQEIETYFLNRKIAIWTVLLKNIRSQWDAWSLTVSKCLEICYRQREV